MKLLLLTVTLGIAGCTVVSDPFTLVRVTGTVTEAGAPAPAIVHLIVGQTVSGGVFPDGTYEVSPGGGGIPASNCASVAVRARHLASDLQTVLGEQTRSVAGCGDHVVDFVFP